MGIISIPGKHTSTYMKHGLPFQTTSTQMTNQTSSACDICRASPDIIIGNKSCFPMTNTKIRAHYFTLFWLQYQVNVLVAFILFQQPSTVQDKNCTSYMLCPMLLLLVYGNMWARSVGIVIVNDTLKSFQCLAKVYVCMNFYQVYSHVISQYVKMNMLSCRYDVR